MRRSVRSFNIPSLGYLTFWGLRIGWFKFPPASSEPQLRSNAPPNIERFFVWSTNVVEFSEAKFQFFVHVLLLDFSLVSIILWCENCLSHESRFFSVCYSVKTLHFKFKCPTAPRQGSNSPTHWARKAFKCPWVARGMLKLRCHLNVDPRQSILR